MKFSPWWNKKSVRTRWTIVIGALVAIIAICAGAWYAAHRHVVVPPFPGVKAPFSQQDAYWQARIKAVGGAAAYQEFAQDVAGYVPSDQHQAAHQFGGALYEVEGLPGLSVCDANFSYGCFHEFLGRAIASLGLSVVDQLDQSCFSVHGIGLACQHGIGHGILAYVGYSQPDLLKALTVCSTVPYIDPIGGCYSGAFMEYNFQTMLGNVGYQRQPTSDMFSPCDQLPALYGASCYFNQAQWWGAYFQSQQNNMPQKNFDLVFEKVGALCDKAPAAFVKDCFEGIGNVVPPSAKYDPARAKQLCIDAASDPTDQLYCREFAANSIAIGGSGNVNGNGLPVCDGLTGGAYEECSQFATNKANIATPPTEEIVH